jgi:class 3 adenylate cyclase
MKLRKTRRKTRLPPSRDVSCVLEHTDLDQTLARPELDCRLVGAEASAIEPPQTHYTRSGDVNVAYQVTGDGPFDLVLVSPFASNIELMWQVPGHAAFYRRMGSFCRLIRFDKRGTGMSDRTAGAPSLETRMDDVRAVMDAAGSEQAALLGVAEGGQMAVLFSAIYPTRVWALVLWAASPRTLWAPDYPFGRTDEDRRRARQDLQAQWTEPERMLTYLAQLAPSVDDENARALAAALRQSASPGDIEALHRMNDEVDVRHVLPAVRVPALVMVRSGDGQGEVAGSRYLADHIAGARYTELPGEDHPIWAGDPEPPLVEIRGFLEDAWALARVADAETDRVLTTLLFTDIVASTESAARLGDRAWREVLARHHGLVRRELLRFRGVELDTAGDGFFARFDGPARAIRCAASIVETVRTIGLEVRAGLHTGECELFERKVGGIAVSLAARVCSEAGPGEVLVSSTVKELVGGAGIEFEDRGEREFKGIPEAWHLFSVVQ